MNLSELKVVDNNYKTEEDVPGRTLEGFGTVFGRMFDFGDRWRFGIYTKDKNKIFSSVVLKSNTEMVDKTLLKIKEQYGVSF